MGRFLKAFQLDCFFACERRCLTAAALRLSAAALRMSETVGNGGPGILYERQALSMPRLRS